MGAYNLSFYFFSNKWKRPIKFWKTCPGGGQVDIGPFSISWYGQKKAV